MCNTVTTSHKLKLLLLTNSKAESDYYDMTYNTILYATLELCSYFRELFHNFNEGYFDECLAIILLNL